MVLLGLVSRHRHRLWPLSARVIARRVAETSMPERVEPSTRWSAWPVAGRGTALLAHEGRSTSGTPGNIHPQDWSKCRSGVAIGAPTFTGSVDRVTETVGTQRRRQIG